ncbi:SDR family NAD(P)-dependent oxidoreductase [Terriglobus sp. YAF25]|uniref:SDR family NAD(P)-dependent oxidoreductase n=1 Tax=Terriglobus sp. YAF25 TaxID=3233080 RepID=UPI003F9BD4D0
MNLSGMTAVVVGGTSGIGKALALGLARHGANIVATSRSQQSVNEIAHELQALGTRHLAIASDVASRDSLGALRDAVLAEFGSVEILVNSAGMTKRIPTLEVDDELWNQILDVNLTGTLRACQVFGKVMLEQRFGRIINIASLASFAASTGQIIAVDGGFLASGVNQ